MLHWLLATVCVSLCCSFKTMTACVLGGWMEGDTNKQEFVQWASCHHFCSIYVALRISVRGNQHLLHYDKLSKKCVSAVQSWFSYPLPISILETKKRHHYFWDNTYWLFMTANVLHCITGFGFIHFYVAAVSVKERIIYILSVFQN